MLNVLLMAGAAAAALTAILVFVMKVVRPVRRAWRRLDDFLGDWFGEPARPGQSARPGVMERLARVEERTAELKPAFGGSSLADAVNRIEEKVSEP